MEESITQVELVTEINSWFAQKLTSLNYSDDTIAYVVGVLSTHKKRSDHDLSDQSIVLSYIAACQNGDFSTYQKIGDWVLWVSTIHPESIKDNEEIVQNLGRMSYYACHRIIRTWHIYEELGDKLPTLAIDIRKRLFLIVQCIVRVHRDIMILSWQSKRFGRMKNTIS